MKTKGLFLAVIAIVAVSFLTSGCAVNFYKQNPRSKKKIEALEAKVMDLETERETERIKFEEVQRILAKKFQEEITEKQMSLKMNEGQLVIIVSDDILFDSGKSRVKESARAVLDKVAEVINKEVPGKNIGISGHTDNLPIKHSNWTSNWELSTSRATNVLHYLIERSIPPERLSATGYGEHRPIVSNEDSEGRSQNRRVEIAILPEFTEKRPN
ncbi:MAG: flagellar motor protein MotB [Candidatus Omnitrophota bacterium]